MSVFPVYLPRRVELRAVWLVTIIINRKLSRAFEVIPNVRHTLTHIILRA